MNTARLAAVTAFVTIGLIAVGNAATAGGGPATTPLGTSTVAPAPASPIDGPGGTPGPPAPGPPAAAGIGFDEASRIAVERAGGGRVTDADWDVERGRQVWEVEVLSGRTEHELTLDADSGAVLRHERDYDDGCS